MLLEELVEINYAFAHAFHIVFENWYDLEKLYEEDPTEENKHKVEKAHADFELVSKGYKLFAKLMWEPARVSGK